jgi:hypothetical protein
MAQLPFVVVWAVADELVDELLELALLAVLLLEVLLAGVVVAVVLELSSEDDVVADAVVACVATWVVEDDWSTAIAPPRPRKLAMLNTAAARGLRRGRLPLTAFARFARFAGVCMRFMRATVRTLRMSDAKGG